MSVAVIAAFIEPSEDISSAEMDSEEESGSPVVFLVTAVVFVDAVVDSACSSDDEDDDELLWFSSNVRFLSGFDVVGIVTASFSSSCAGRD